MPSAPTEVKRLSVVAGNGPPCCMLRQTSTPVGTPFNINRPQIFFTASTNSSLFRISFSVAINVAVNCPSRLAPPPAFPFYPCNGSRSNKDQILPGGILGCLKMLFRLQMQVAASPWFSFGAEVAARNCFHLRLSKCFRFFIRITFCNTRMQAY